MERGTQGQGTRNGSLPFKDQVAGEGEILSGAAFPAQRLVLGTVYTASGASALTSTSFEEAAIDVSPLRLFVQRRMIRLPST